MNSRTAINICLGIVAVVTVFHLCILVKIIPYEITWGGRLKNDSEMYVFETISIAINLILGVVLLVKGRYVKQVLSKRLVQIVLWIFLVLFLLNTVGNLFAETVFEKSLSLLTLALAILIWIILKAKDVQEVERLP